MRNCILGSLLVLSLCSNAFAGDVSISKVQIEPLSGGVSFNTVYATWGASTPAPEFPMKSRKEILITNMSTTENVYITGVSGSTAYGTIFPMQTVSFKTSSAVDLYVSADTVVPCEIWEIR